MEEFEHIIYQAEVGRARITLNSALWEADNDKDVHCVTLRRAGSKMAIRTATMDMTTSSSTLTLHKIALGNRHEGTKGKTAYANRDIADLGVHLR